MADGWAQASLGRRKAVASHRTPQRRELAAAAGLRVVADVIKAVGKVLPGHDGSLRPVLDARDHLTQVVVLIFPICPVGQEHFPIRSTSGFPSESTFAFLSSADSSPPSVRSLTSARCLAFCPFPSGGSSEPTCSWLRFGSTPFSWNQGFLQSLIKDPYREVNRKMKNRRDFCSF